MVPHSPVTVIDGASVALAREQVRAAAAAIGFGRDDGERLALAVSELAQNQLDHARRGRIGLRAVCRAGVPGLEIRATDEGDGIPDLAGVLAGRVRGKGLGAGLRTVRRIALELDADVRAGEGTTLVVRRFVGPVPPEPEVAVVGRGTEVPSGDHAVVLRDRGLVVAVIDGAGHGLLAREAADRAAAAVRGDRDPVEILTAMEDALRGTRGAAASVVRVDPAGGRVEIAGTGNVGVRWDDGERWRTYLPRPGLLGVRRAADGRADGGTLGPRGVLVFTDGVSARVDLPGVGDGSAVEVAWRVLAGWAKAHDDALVVSVR